MASNSSGVFAVINFMQTVVSLMYRLHVKTLHSSLKDQQLCFAFVFVYFFPYFSQTLVRMPNWTSPGVWYVFMLYSLCNIGNTAMILTICILFPMTILTQDLTRMPLQDLNGAERLLIAHILVALRCSHVMEPMFLLGTSIQMVVAVIFGDIGTIHWILLFSSFVALSPTEKDNSPTRVDEFVIPRQIFDKRARGEIDINANSVSVRCLKWL